MTLRRAAAALLLAAAALAGPAAAQARPVSLSVAGAQGGWRPVVAMDGVLRDDALLDALKGGLPLRFHFRVELWRRGAGVDRLVEARENARAMLRAPLDEGYTLEDGRTQHAYATLPECEAALERAFQPPIRPPGRGRYYYIAVLNVETLSMSDLDELRRWLRGEARPAVTGSRPVERAVESGVKRFFVRLLGIPTRRYDVRTPVFEVR
ncbi:MAG TPA: hypothetical protein VFJ82_02095 [Longimicrobium sp.]|nr:hypothetical protein [Longimicrobium sp.]